MLYKIEMDDTSTPDWITGSYNVAPDGWQEISAFDFASAQSSYAPKFMEYRQLYRTKDGKCFTRQTRYGDVVETYISVQMFWHWDKTGVAIERDYDNKAVRYYRFGCEHVWESMPSPGRMLHRSLCRKCGSDQTVDSSD